MAIQLKRIYDPFCKSDGVRLLVDRLWPRGVSKEAARLDGWPKELAPSPELRKWFHHSEQNFARFLELYRAELDSSELAQAMAKEVIKKSRQNTVTLLYGAKDEKINHAVCLKEYLDEKAQSL